MLAYRVQLLGTIARGNFSCNLTRTEVNLTTGTFLGFIASLARLFFATNGNAITIFYVLSKDVTLSNASCKLSQRRNKNAGRDTFHETLASVSAPNKYKQINDKILLETLT